MEIPTDNDFHFRKRRFLFWQLNKCQNGKSDDDTCKYDNSDFFMHKGSPLKIKVQKWVIACVDKVGGGKQHQNRHQNDASVIADSRNFVCELNSQLLWQIRRTDDRNDE